MPDESKQLTSSQIKGIRGHLWIQDLEPEYQFTNAVQVLCYDIKQLLDYIELLETRLSGR